VAFFRLESGLQSDEIASLFDFLLSPGDAAFTGQYVASFGGAALNTFFSSPTSQPHENRQHPRIHAPDQVGHPQRLH
jgi:hypothetical protein